MLVKVLCSVGVGMILAGVVGCNLVTPVDQTGGSPLVGSWSMTRQIKHQPDGSADTMNASTAFGNRYRFSNDYSLSGTAVVFGIPIDFSGTWSTAEDSVILSTTTLGETSSQTWGFSVMESVLFMTRAEVAGTTVITTEEQYQKQ